jgi:ribonuclease P protein component
VRREGKRIRTEHLEVRAIASLLPYARVGFVVPKYKHGSVERNRLKRRLREIVRRRVLRTLVGLSPADVVIRTLPAAYEAPFDALERQVTQSCERAVRRVAVPANGASSGASTVATATAPASSSAPHAPPAPEAPHE